MVRSFSMFPCLGDKLHKNSSPSLSPYTGYNGQPLIKVSLAFTPAWSSQVKDEREKLPDLILLFPFESLVYYKGFGDLFVKSLGPLNSVSSEYGILWTHLRLSLIHGPVRRSGKVPNLQTPWNQEQKYAWDS